MKVMATAVFLVAISGAAVFAQEAQKHAAVKPVVANIVNAQGQTVGTATLSDSPQGVKVKLDIKNLPPGPHLMHIHEFAICEGPDFKSAGAHFNGGDAHGEHAHGAMPAGDIPNFVLTVQPDGTAHVSVIAPGVTMGSEPNSVFANGGTALVIHAVAQEVSASAPPRIACAVIVKGK